MPPKHILNIAYGTYTIEKWNDVDHLHTFPAAPADFLAKCLNPFAPPKINVPKIATKKITKNTFCQISFMLIPNTKNTGDTTPNKIATFVFIKIFLSFVYLFDRLIVTN